MFYSPADISASTWSGITHRAPLGQRSITSYVGALVSSELMKNCITATARESIRNMWAVHVLLTSSFIPVSSGFTTWISHMATSATSLRHHPTLASRHHQTRTAGCYKGYFVFQSQHTHTKTFNTRYAQHTTLLNICGPCARENSLHRILCLVDKNGTDGHDVRCIWRFLHKTHKHVDMLFILYKETSEHLKDHPETDKQSR